MYMLFKGVSKMLTAVKASAESNICDAHIRVFKQEGCSIQPKTILIGYNGTVYIFGKQTMQIGTVYSNIVCYLT